MESYIFRAELFLYTPNRLKIIFFFAEWYSKDYRVPLIKNGTTENNITREKLLKCIFYCYERTLPGNGTDPLSGAISWNCLKKFVVTQQNGIHIYRTAEN